MLKRTFWFVLAAMIFTSLPVVSTAKTKLPRNAAFLATSSASPTTLQLNRNLPCGSAFSASLRFSKT